MANTIYVLTGPTASGKTALALAWAERYGAEILSCDALLFYRGMDIGTAKPTKAERERIPHHGVDLNALDESYDVGRYVAYARACVEAIWARGKHVLVTGGSGFYLKSFFAPVVDGLNVSAEVRAQVQGLYARGGLELVLEALRARNPEGLGELDVHNPVRVLRALERCLESGKTIRQLREAFEALASPFAEETIKLTVLEREDDSLRKRVAARTQGMLEAGLVEEVKQLREAGLLRNPAAVRAIGYAQTLDWLARDGEDRTALAEAINQATWQLVRKQRSWFRNQLPVGRSILLEDSDVPESIIASLFEGVQA